MSSAVMNYKSVKYFSPSARGDCSLAWQRGWAQIGTQSGDSWENVLSEEGGESVGMEGGEGWKVGKMEVGMDGRTEG